jgi:hypothetical protein
MALIALTAAMSAAMPAVSGSVGTMAVLVRLSKKREQKTRAKNASKKHEQKTRAKNTSKERKQKTEAKD